MSRTTPKPSPGPRPRRRRGDRRMFWIRAIGSLLVLVMLLSVMAGVLGTL